MVSLLVLYQRIEEYKDLPPAGPSNARSREKSDLDFKKRADPSTLWEHAKDIAAFANALGGVLLLGAEEINDSLTYPGLGGQTVADVKNIYEQAAKQCSPAPVVDVVPIPMPGGVTVVAVNVDPYVDQIVGARADTRDSLGKQKLHDRAWMFPLRVATQTKFIDPENLPMYMNREVRRAVLLLARIPTNCRSEVTVHYHKPREIENQHWDGVTQIASGNFSLTDVSVERNALTLLKHMGSHTTQCRVPLLDVMDVWESKDGKWDIKLTGRLHTAKGGQFQTLTYMPMPK